MALPVEGKSPYRIGEAPLARYPLRTSRWHSIALGVAFAVCAALAVGLLAIDFHGVYLGVMGWVLLIAMVCVAFWLGTQFPRYCVAPGGAIVLHRDRVLVPAAFSGPPDEIPIDELELEVQIKPHAHVVEIEGVRRHVVRMLAAGVLIGRRPRPRVLHPSVFANESQPMRLADDVRRIRAGMALADHENIDVDALFADFEHVFAALKADLDRPPPKDDYDDRLDAELRALDAPRKSGKK
jgi:hypothetical protein